MTSDKRRSASNGTGFSDEYLCALTRGLYVPESRDTRPGPQDARKVHESFEETYPKYPFAPLVRIVLRLAAWLGAGRSKTSAEARAARSAAGDDGTESSSHDRTY